MRYPFYLGTKPWAELWMGTCGLTHAIVLGEVFFHFLEEVVLLFHLNCHPWWPLFCSTWMSCVLGSGLRSCIQNLPILGILVVEAQLPRSSYKRPTWWPSSTELSTRLSNSWEEGTRAERSVGQNAAIWMKTRTSCSFVLARSRGQIQYFCYFFFFCSLWQCTLDNEITRFAFLEDKQTWFSILPIFSLY